MAESALLLVTTKIGIAVAAETLHHVRSVAKLSENMTLIRNDLELIRAFLKEIGRKNSTDGVTEAWIGQVRRLAYDMEDIVDQFMYVIGKQHQKGSWWSSVKKILKKPQHLFTLGEISTGLEKINRALTHLKQNRDWTQPIVGVGDVFATNYDSQQQLYLPGHDYSISDDELVGFDKNRKILMGSLNLENCLNLQIIALWGMGGIGKSTLVSNVFRKEAPNFECHAWVSVSQSYKLDDIWRRMLKEIYSKDKKEFHAEKMTCGELQDELKEILKKKRYLIILDDVWTAEDFRKIKEVLVDAKMGSRIIITTRSEEVASIAHDGCRIKVEPLEEEDAWRLFCRKAFPNTENHICPLALQEYGKLIVGRCDGLPLALVAIGSSLSLKAQNLTEWKLFDEQLIFELHKNENLSRVVKILNLSYKYLPDYLKSCFLYCAMFPEDHMIHRKRLIRLWIAEGFIEQIGKCSLEDVAEGYLGELVRRSMLHVVERNSFNRIKCLQMHDLVRELAIFQSSRESFSMTYDDGDGVTQVKPDSRRLSVLQCKNDTEPSMGQCRLRTFIAFSSNTASSALFPSESKYLAVLELSGLPIKTVPNSIGELFNLKYLGLGNTYVKILPKSVTKLHNLETLKLKGAQCVNLPKEFGKLKKLRHLLIYKYLDRTGSSFKYCDPVDPFEGLWTLKDLQTLRAVRGSKVFIAKLACLSQLRGLHITGISGINCAQLCDSLSKMQQLSLLAIEASNEDEVLQLETLTLSNRLKKLFLSGRISEGTWKSPFFSTNGDALYIIYLHCSHLVENPVPRLSELSNLTDIRLCKAYTGQELTFQPEWFPNVKTLSLYDLPHVNQIYIHERALVRLEDLQIGNLAELRDIPAGLEHLKSLKEAWFGDMHPDFERNFPTTKLEHVPKVRCTIR
ncbi:disease resistance protein RPM1-like [Hordeum vulgare subsp. vulgare]|nr:disease resistance protein RPM1-like [Hordeum vulgare subsp. vulgare]